MRTEEGNAVSSTTAQPEVPAHAQSWLSTVRNGIASVGDHVFARPPKEEDLGFLRRSYVLAALCHQVYTHKESDTGSAAYIPVPRGDLQGDTIPVKAKLLHFREALDNGHTSGPQQYGIWHVSHGQDPSEDFLVVAFRGTWSMEDVFIDVNITPTPLSAGGQSNSGLSVHHGFLNGAMQHADKIVKALRRADELAGKKLPVWVTGHSLGGAYANALLLHLLDSGRTNDLFELGGGSCTFGAPMVVHSADSEHAYVQLAALEAKLADYKHHRLSFHNFVNNADPVPRLLGGSLDHVHGLLELKFPRVKNVRKIAKEYHPFGQYHIIIGSEVRSLRMPLEDSTGSSLRLGNADYAILVNQQLDLTYMWRNLYGTTGRGAGWTPHNMNSYQERLSTHMEAVIHSHCQAELAASSIGGSTEELRAAKSTSIFHSDPCALQGAQPSNPAGIIVGDLTRAGAQALGRAAWSWWKGDSRTGPNPSV